MSDAQAERAHWNGVTKDDELMWASVRGTDFRVIEYLDAIVDGLAVPDGARVLDLGCGLGRHLCPLAERMPTWELIGVDASPEMLRVTQKRCPGVRVDRGDGRSLPYVDAFFDGVYCVNVLQHIPEDAVRGYISEVARVLRPSGVFRFQYVEGTNHTFLAHDYEPKNMEHWCAANGLLVQQVEKGRLEENWQWVTATKRVRT